MKKTFECEIPDWANWLATDEDGLVFAFKDKPGIDGSVWCSQGEIHEVANVGDCPNWKETLERISR
jgi:hypothetical protein